MRAYFPFIWYLINTNSQYLDFYNFFSQSKTAWFYTTLLFIICSTYNSAMMPNTPSELTVYVTIMLGTKQKLSLCFNICSCKVKIHNVSKTIESIK